ncbi:MAG: cell envelope integrity protein TolA [Rickettsiaceae bacterium]|nr:cell envelope integrity protein TolA [Rickettsiaceae bacterium]
MINSKESDYLFAFFLLSVLLHAIILAILIFGFNFHKKKLPEERIISFDIVAVSNINNIKTQKNEKSEQILNEDAKQINQTLAKEIIHKNDAKNKQEQPNESLNHEKIPKEEPKKAEKNLESLQQVQKTIESLKEDKSEQELPKEENKQDKPKEEPKPKIEKDTPKEEQKTESPKKEESPKKKAASNKELDSILKNLEKSSTGNNKSKAVNRKNTSEQKDAFGNFDETLPESLTNYEMIKQQIMRKWNQPVASATENILVTLRITIDSDGAVLRAIVINLVCPHGKESICYATRDSVIRAALNASPLENLSTVDYDDWHEIDVHFDTRR